MLMTNLEAIVRDIKEVVTGNHELPTMLIVRSRYLHRFIGLYFPFGMITAFSYGDKPLLSYGFLHEINHDRRKNEDGLLKNYLNMVFNRLSVEREVTANAARDFNRLRSIKGYKVKPAEEAWLSNFHSDPKLSISLIIDYGRHKNNH